MGLLVRFLLQSFSPSLEVVLYKKIDCQSKRCPLNFLCSKNFQGWLLKIFNGWFFFSRFQILQNLNARLHGEFYWQTLHGPLFASRVFCPDFFTGRNWNFHRKKNDETMWDTGSYDRLVLLQGNYGCFTGITLGMWSERKIFEIPHRPSKT